MTGFRLCIEKRNIEIQFISFHKKLNIFVVFFRNNKVGRFGKRIKKFSGEFSVHGFRVLRSSDFQLTRKPILADVQYPNFSCYSR